MENVTIGQTIDFTLLSGSISNNSLVPLYVVGKRQVYLNNF